MTPEHVRLLYDYNAWANQRVLDACAALTAEQFTRDLGSSFPSVRDTLVHIFGTEWVYLVRWHGRSPDAAEVRREFAAERYPDLASVRAFARSNGERLLDFVRRQTAEDLARIHTIRTTKGEPYEQPLWEMLVHLVNHSTYHRGQAATLLRQLGAKPNSTDMIYFFRERAARAVR